MPSIRDQGVCIRQWDWSETSQTVCIFAREFGVLRALAKGSRRDRSAFSGGIEPLSRADFTAITKPAGSLHLLTSWDLGETFPRCRTDLASFHAGFYLADLTGLGVQDEDPHPRLYDAFVAALRAIGAPETAPGEAGVQRALLEFQWELLLETGHKPELDAHARTHRPVTPGKAVGFSPHLGGIVDDPGPTPGGAVWRARPETIDLLRALAAKRSLDEVPPDSLRRAGRLLGWYIRERLEIDPPTLAGVYPPLRGEGRPDRR